MAMAATGTFMLLNATPAHALVINATYGTGSSAFSAAAVTTINSVITLYQNTFSDNVTANITFNNMSSGLGQSQTAAGSVTYAQYLAQLTADKTTANDTTAVATLLANPGSGNIVMTTANARALGFGTPGVTTDSTIGLNAGICFTGHGASGTSGYDLFAVASHELDEALGTSSGLSYNGSGQPVAGAFRDTDLFRYNGNAAGVLWGAAATPQQLRPRVLLLRWRQSTG